MDKAERRVANTAAKAATVRMVVAAATVRTVTADEMAATSVKSATAVAVARAVSQVRTEDRSRFQYISAIRPIRENFRISGGGLMPFPHNFVLQIFANVLGRSCKTFRAVQSFITLFICLFMQISLILKNFFRHWTSLLDYANCICAS